MISTVQPGRGVLERMALYRKLDALGVLRESYAGKFALAAFVGILIPLATFIVYLLFARADWSTMYPVLAALVLACFAGFLGTLWILRELLVPIDLTAEALRNYIEKRQLPDLPIAFPDRAGKLMEGTQYTLAQLHETINRLERVSDTDDLTGIYNRRAGEKRLAEEVARAERDLQTFQLAFFDINKFKQINDRHGHSAGDACISHVAALLQLNTRRGDWVARWGGDEFIVGLHRNRALKMVMERIVKAISSSPCEIAPGLEVRLSVSCGVAEYRFGSGALGVLADADKAMYVAKEMGRDDGKSHISYRGELAQAVEAQAAQDAA
ncbi:MAG TPA: GGDEF domain-containing protein [Usitatibacter sp.]|nr:GGDEF domain-containing protein [Usitatibacter sp.]